MQEFRRCVCANRTTLDVCSAACLLAQALLVHAGVAHARNTLVAPPDASPGDGPPGEADIADDDLGQFIRTPDEIELLGLLRKHLHRSLPDVDDAAGEQPEDA